MLFKIDKVIIYIFIVIVSLLSLSNTTNAAVLPPGNISTCGELAVGGTYTLTTDVGTSTELCFIITADSVVIDGASTYTISGDIGGNRDSYTINNATTTGNLSYFYYNNADDDGDWTNMGNWWLDSSYSQTANLGNISEPTLEDTTFIDGAVYRASSGNTPQSKTITFNNNASFSAATLPLDIATATAAYSLRNLSRTYAGDVVRVRRDSDDAQQDFSAQEVGDGTLVDWVVPDLMQFDGVDDYISLGSSVTLTGTFTIEAKIYFNGTNAVALVGNSATDNFNFINIQSDGRINVEPNVNNYPIIRSVNTGVVPSGEISTIRMEFDFDNETYAFYVNNVEVATQLAGTTASPWSSTGLTFNRIGARSTARATGVIYDLKVWEDLTQTSLIHHWKGYGNTDADWVDQEGSIDGIVNGSPALYSGEVNDFNGYVTNWYDQTFDTLQERMYFDSSNSITLPSSINLSGDFDIDVTVAFDSFSGVDGVFMESSGAIDGVQFVDSDTFRFRLDSVNYDFDLDSALNLNQAYDININRTGSTITLTIDGQEQSNTVNASGTFSVLYVGGYRDLVGTLYDLNINNVSSYQGYGNTDADWVDQIGSNNARTDAWSRRTNLNASIVSSDAVQTTASAQPTIVTDGTLNIVESKTSINMDGTDDYLLIDRENVFPTIFAGQDNNFWTFHVAYWDRNGNTRTGIFGTNSIGNFIGDGEFAIGGAVGVYNTFLINDTGVNGNPGINTGRYKPVNLSRNLHTNHYSFNSGDASLSVYENSSLYETGSATFTDQNYSADGNYLLGARSTTNIFTKNKFQEVLVYLSNQTSNREQIEASINDYYDIYVDDYTYELDLEVATTGTVTFNDNSYFGNGKISTAATTSIDTITFNDNSYAMDIDLYADNITFNTNASSTGTYETKTDNTSITIDAINSASALTLTGSSPSLTFNGTSTLNTLTVGDTDITLNDSSYLTNFTLNGTDTSITFNTDYYSGTTAPTEQTLIVNGTKTLEGTFTQYSSNDLDLLDADGDPLTEIQFNGTTTNNISNVPVYTTFNDNSTNTGTIRANTTFNDTSTNTGTIYGNATVNSPVSKPLGGSVTGNITYVGYDGFYYNNAAADGDYNNSANWWTNASFTTPASVPNSGGDDINIYGDLTTPTTSAIEIQSANFYSGTNNLTFITTDEVNFYNSAVNNGVISGTTTFHGDSAEHSGFVSTSTAPLTMYFDGINDYVDFGSVGNCGVNCRVEVKFSANKTGSFVFLSQRDSTRSFVLAHNALTRDIYFYNDNGSIKIWDDSLTSTDLLDGAIHTLLVEKDGDNFDVTVDGETQSVTKAFADSGDTGDFGLGGNPNETAEFGGLMYGLKIDAGNTGSWQNVYKGYGNTNSDWTDQIGNNDGTVVGSPTATTTVTENTGTLTRRYESDTNVSTRDFTENNGIWIIEAASADVDLSSATYSRTNNIFRAIAGGTFTENTSIDGGANVVPKVEITYPLNGTNTALWNPTIDWSDADTCEYKYGAGGTYTTVNCANNGSDIPQPTALVETTLYVKGSYTNTSYSEQLQTFTYDNVSPIAIDCSIPLSEATREYYYLDSNINTDCYITASSTIDGMGYTINGSVIANASSTDTNGYNLSLENITITGTTTANGKDGGNGGNITISDSTTASIEANGSATTTDGGDGGTITITNSLANPLTSTITANGGSSLSCGNGGDGGIITLTNSTYGTLTAQAGEAENSGCPLENKTSGSAGTQTQTGQHSSQVVSSSNSSTNSSTSGGGTTSLTNLTPFNPLNFTETPEFTPITNFTPTQVGATVIPNPFDNFQAPGQPQFAQLPFNFGLNISNFLFNNQLPQDIDETINNIPALNNLASSGILNLTPQQIARLSTKPVKIDNIGDDQGLYIIEDQYGNPFTTYLTYRDRQLAQLVRVKGGENVKVRLQPLTEGDVFATYQGITFPFSSDTKGQYIDIQILPQKGTYKLTSTSTLVPLLLEVVSDGLQIKEDTRYTGLIPRILDWLFTIF